MNMKKGEIGLIVSTEERETQRQREEWGMNTLLSSEGLDFFDAEKKLLCPFCSYSFLFSFFFFLFSFFFFISLSLYIYIRRNFNISLFFLFFFFFFS
jgi:hypothetical protein